ncbi:hypothetical protein CAL29_27160 [Bordetella genomosp. 10]|uniref:DUF4062 domain-containing protein n=1 Tax=Bordetella genomosp. 10 TaxID=1416804 RepID=A0A261S564_9BORD|nr:DUF4062 domain-containing protein [Bordetella genomosp. 10]OZI31573.1 hypothetical protein CAL29_27160 [Bordetella genomosp. 10]
MSSIKYQVFVSSTYDDLKDERSQVIKAILEMGHIPVGMEMFSAADEEQWKIIARQIDETDYYVVIVGSRYGSVTGGVSYTEKEFDYAVSKGIPVLGFIIDSSVDPLAKHTDKEEEKIAALTKFKAKVKQRPVGFWKTADDLHGRVSIALMKAFNTTPRIGWTRATAITGPEVTQELSRLSRENAELRAQLEAARKQEVIDRRTHLQQRIETLQAIPTTLAIREHGKSTWDIEVETNLFEIFSQLAPEMMVETSTNHASIYLALLNKPDKEMRTSNNAPIAVNHVRLLFADLASLDLVEPSKKKHSVADTDTYWTLTQEGSEVLKLDRATRLEAYAAKAVTAAEAGEKEVASTQKRATREV